MEQEHGLQWRKLLEDEDEEEGAAEKVSTYHITYTAAIMTHQMYLVNPVYFPVFVYFSSSSFSHVRAALVFHVSTSTHRTLIP